MEAYRILYERGYLHGHQVLQANGIPKVDREMVPKFWDLQHYVELGLNGLISQYHPVRVVNSLLRRL